jgi:predicted N-acetyltransferase YhbS
MNFKIEQESQGDFQEIYQLVKIAFQTAAHADGDEHDYVNKLRESDNYIPELALVLREGSNIIAHIMLTRTFIDTKHGFVDALLLSPICVQLENRNQGIAAVLINHSLEKAKIMGYKAVFLVGEPGYYQRFGFKSIQQFDIVDTGDIPVEYTMVLELETGFLLNNGGRISIC